jgi:OOP family OmpA-OmpF porin
LIERGISADRIETIGKGVEHPRFDNSTREGRKLNRRVEFTEIFS